MHMALPRLSLAERRVLLQNQGFLKAARSLSLSSSSSYSSSSSSAAAAAAAAAPAALGKSTKTSLSKRSEAAKVQKSAAVESFVKKYMLMNPGVFPKIKQVQNELGGSWYILKDILAELKEKMTGDPQVYKEIASAKADIMLEAASEAAVTDENEVGAMVNDPESTTGLVDLCKTRNTNTGADKKNAMKIETLNRDRNPGTTMASANEFEKKQCMPVFIDRIMEFVKSTLPRDIVDQSNPNRTLINKNGMGTVLEGMQFLNPDEEQKTLCEHDISKDTRKPERGKTWAEPLDLVVENSSGTESKLIDHASICDETDHNDNDEEPLKVPFEMSESQKDGSGSDSDTAALDYPSESATDISPPINVLKPRTILRTERKAFRDKLLVRFLKKTATEKDIGAAFGNCGPITNICIVPSRKENRFNYAYINFKSAAGLQNAQVKTDIVINGADVAVEAVPPFLRNPVKIPTPSTFGCPDVLKGLLRHPSRTVMIKPLPHDLASRHLRRALSVFGCISGFAMGSLSSIAYVEFETEDAKEKALAMSSISISGRKLAILRIDAPLTTVVRISNIGFLSGEEIHNICNPHGRVKRVIRRTAQAVDVHFMLTEWSNMVKIINSLNGLVINEHQWQAQPAPVIPPEILQMLWRKPDGWRYVCSLAQSLCQKIEQDSTTNTSELADLLTEYRGESIES